MGGGLLGVGGKKKRENKTRKGGANRPRVPLGLGFEQEAAAWGAGAWRAGAQGRRGRPAGHLAQAGRCSFFFKSVTRAEKQKKNYLNELRKI